MKVLKSKSGFWMAMALIAVAALTLSVVFAVDPPPPYFIVNDLNGANDEPGQKDINKMGRFDDPAGYLDFFWNWDESVTGGSTLDACALFDSDGDANINFAICGQVGSDNKLTAGQPKAYSCQDTDKFHCKVPLPLNPVGDDLLAGTLAGLDPAGDLTTNTDPFGPRNASEFPEDITLRIKLKKSFFSNAVLTNVCTYPSHTIDSSDYSDCVSNVGGGFLRIVKNTPNANGSFTFKVNPVAADQLGGDACSPSDPQTCRSFTITTVAGTGEFLVGADVTATETVSETVPSGWILSSASCQIEGEAGTTGNFDSINTISGIALASGKFTTCTFTNTRQPAKLTVTKVVINDNGGTAVAGDFTLKVNSTVVTSGQQNQIEAGDYVVSETGGPAGYVGSIDGDCAADGSIHMEPGEVYACTITNNDVAPSLTLSKIVVTDNGGTASGSAWTLSATCTTSGTCDSDVLSGAGAASSTSSFKAGAYSLAENGGPSGYTAGAWQCTGGSQNGSNITLAVGESASCTITNDDQQGTLIVRKVVVNDNGGTKTATDFSFQVNGGSTTSFLAGGNSLSLDAGTYTVTEPAVVGYTTTYDGCSNVALGNGQTVTCTVTNDDIGPGLTLRKVVVNNNGGTATAADWTLTGKLGGVTKLSGPGPVVSETGSDFDAGTYALSESGGPSGYTASDWSCSINGGTAVTGNSVTLGVGDNATCTITNDDDAPSLRLVKNVVNDNGGTASAEDWTLTADGGSAGSLSGNGGAVSGPTFQAGTYSLSESAGPAGYNPVGWSCVKNGGAAVAGDSISVAAGDSATCTVTNDDIAPSLTLIKFVNNTTSNDATKTADEFVLSATGAGASISGGGTVTSGPTFKAGTYTLSEANTAGYVGSAWSCDNGILFGNSLTLSIGQVATCSILNTAVNISPVIKVDKTVTPKNLDSNGGTVTFTVTVTNQSGPYDPVTITSFSDDIYGDLSLLADAKLQETVGCEDALGKEIPGGGSYTCSWTVVFPKLPAAETLSETDTVTVTVVDEDNAGESSSATASDSATVTQSLPIIITNGTCKIDQYTRIFSQDAAYHFTATNNGQFFYNMSISGTPGEVVHVTLELPWPFVTQGNQPVHVYESVEYENGCFKNLVGAYAFDKYVVLKDYGVDYPTVKQGYLPELKKTKVELEVTIPQTGFAFIRQHIDDGLKGPAVDVNGDGILDDLSYGKDTAENATDPQTAAILMPENFVHPFYMWGFTCSVLEADCDINPATTDDIRVQGGTSLTNDNQFQKNVGVGGIVQYDGLFVQGATVQLWYGSTLVGTATTDSFGMYSIAHKHKGKADVYTVLISDPFASISVMGGSGTISGQSSGQPDSTVKTATIKANGLVIVNFPLVP